MLSEKKVIHILNGDALKSQLSNVVADEIIVARECLVDGPVKASSFVELMNVRAKFIDTYPECSAQDYRNNSLSEFEKIINLSADKAVVCWFEDDLFCQVNFWFITSLLCLNSQVKQFYLVRPNKTNEYSFGNMSKQELVASYNNKLLIKYDEHTQLALLWKHYQQNDYDELTRIATLLIDDFPFVLPAVNAHIARKPDKNGLGYPERVLLKIIKKQKEPTFGESFKLFYHQMGIYSFGDLQVKAMYEKLIANFQVSDIEPTE